MKYTAYFDNFFRGLHKFEASDKSSLHLTQAFYTALTKLTSIVAQARYLNSFVEGIVFIERCEWDYHEYAHTDWIVTMIDPGHGIALSPHGRFATIKRLEDGSWVSNTCCLSEKPYRELPFRNIE